MRDWNSIAQFTENARKYRSHCLPFNVH